ncbi:MAG TPA: GAF domain-containing protein [Mycobacteriales bacterium]|nr:GAF domain-containing protein [Mycobacteriales bacterium]
MAVDEPNPHGGADGDLALAATLLGLLAREAPEAEYRALVRSGAPAHRIRMGRLVERALRVRRTLEDRTRREAELVALYETAGDLSSQRDSETVLRAIVRRARDLLDTDAAYLMVNDEARGDTRMRVTEGIHTDAFKATRLDLGAGLGGLVAKTNRPYATANYFADGRFRHTVDDTVRGEGLVAIQGVPLNRGDRVIGVLFVANRRARPFSADEVALLISLANHAAIAIENAALFADVRRAVAELTQANRVIGEHSESAERATALHERLLNILLAGGGLPDVAQALAGLLAGSLLVLDRAGRVTAGVGDDEFVVRTRARKVLPPGCPAARAVSLAYSPGTEARRSRQVTVEGITRPVCITPIVAGSEVLGVVLLVGERIEPADVLALERAALVMALTLLNERSLVEAEHRMRGELLDDLLTTPHRDSAGLRRRALLMGVDIDRGNAVLVARPRDIDRRRVAATEAAAVAVEHAGLSGDHGGNIVLLLPAPADLGSTARSIASRLSQATGSPVTVGASRSPGPDPGGLAQAHRDAARCLEVLLTLDRDGEAASFAELGIYGVLLSGSDRAEYERFVRRVIGPVLDYDEQRGSELTDTLFTYFQCDTNLRRTSAAMYLHVNTLYQRLDRIDQLLGQRWRHGDDALQVHLAVKLHSILSQPERTSPQP